MISLNKKGFYMKTLFRAKTPIAIAIASILTACGGGGGAGESSGSNASVQVDIANANVMLTVAPGASFSLNGATSTMPGTIKSMTWTVTKLTAGAPTITLSNSDCAAADKSGQTLGKSSANKWNCDVTAQAPVIEDMNADSFYRFTLSAVDSNGNSASLYRDVSVAASLAAPISPITVNVAGSKTSTNVPIGNSMTLSGVATSNPNALTSLKWSVTNLVAGTVDLTINNGDCATAQRSKKVSASSVNNVWVCDANITAPAILNNNAIYRLTLHSIDTKGNTATDYQDISVTAGNLVPTIAPITVKVAKPTEPAKTVGQTFVLSGSAITNPNAMSDLKWDVTKMTADTPDLQVTNQTCVNAGKSNQTYGGQSTSTWTCEAVAVAPSAAVDATYRFVLTGTDSAKNLGYDYRDVTVTADPLASLLALTVTGVTNVESNAVVALSVAAKGTTSPLFYEWKQISGPTVALVLANTANMSFISPKVENLSQIVFTVRVAKKPIATASAAEISATDVVVSVAPV